jgi:hypothetical protein
MILSTRPTVWFHKRAPDLGASNLLSEVIANAERRHPGIIPDLRSSQTLLIGSDYSGSHRTARFDVTSVVVTNLENVATWNENRSAVRDALLPESRRMSYKALNDRHRRAALLPFLNTANMISGMLISIAIDRDIRTVFHDQNVIVQYAAEYPELAGWKTGAIERALRIIHFVSLLLRGLSGPGQDVWWFTDQDEIVANDQRLRSFVSLTASISSHYLPQPLRHLRIGTTNCDTARRDIEDYVAIPDFAAGVLQEFLENGDGRLLLSAPSLLLPRNDAIRPKASEIMDWFSDNTQPLRRLSFVIDEPLPGKLRITALRAHGSSDADASRLVSMADNWS